MGPISLFDKSFLQSISVDESVWFDHFFLAVVCPIFYVETLADLAKEPSKRGPPEVIVRELAKKFPEMGGSPCVYHHDMCVNDLLGNRVPMTGQVPRPGGRPVKSGTLYDQAPEEIAFQRWQRGQFEEVERLSAATLAQAARCARSEYFCKRVARHGDRREDMQVARTGAGPRERHRDRPRQDVQSARLGRAGSRSSRARSPKDYCDVESRR